MVQIIGVSTPPYEVQHGSGDVPKFSGEPPLLPTYAAPLLPAEPVHSTLFENVLLAARGGEDAEDYAEVVADRLVEHAVKARCSEDAVEFARSAARLWPTMRAQFEMKIMTSFDELAWDLADAFDSDTESASTKRQLTNLVTFVGALYMIHQGSALRDTVLFMLAELIGVRSHGGVQGAVERLSVAGALVAAAGLCEEQACQPLARFGELKGLQRIL